MHNFQWFMCVLSLFWIFCMYLLSSRHNRVHKRDKWKMKEVFRLVYTAHPHPHLSRDGTKLNRNNYTAIWVSKSRIKICVHHIHYIRDIKKKIFVYRFFFIYKICCTSIIWVCVPAKFHFFLSIGIILFCCVYPYFQII